MRAYGGRLADGRAEGGRRAGGRAGGRADSRADSRADWPAAGQVAEACLSSHPDFPSYSDNAITDMHGFFSSSMFIVQPAAAAGREGGGVLLDEPLPLATIELSLNDPQQHGRSVNRLHEQPTKRLKREQAEASPRRPVFN